MLRILHRDESVLAVDKPAGILTVPGRGPGDTPALSEEVREIAPDALPVHRLDRDTSGVLLFALGRAAHTELNAAFGSRRAEKVYVALGSGDLAAPAKCELPLREGRKGSTRIASAAEKGAQAASTGFRPLERFGRATWIEARPRTGRTHQIRVHLAALELPLLVDPRYGSEGPVRAHDLDPSAGENVVLARTPLHAASIRVPHPSGRGWLQVESPLPDDIARCLDLLRAARRRAG